MEKKLLTFFMSLFLTVGLFGQASSFSAKKLNDQINKGLNISLANKSLAQNFRDFEYPLADTVSLQSLSDENGNYEEDLKLIFKYAEHNNALRIDSIFVVADFSQFPIPITSIGGKARYDALDRYKGYDLNANTIFGPIPLQNFSVEHDDKNRIILAKGEPNALLGEEPYGDSIVYTDNIKGLPESWFRYEIGLHTEDTPYYDSYTAITYDENDVMNGFTESSVSDFFSFSTRYSEVTFYEYDETYPQYFLPEYKEPIAEFLFGLDNNPLNRFKRFIIAGNTEVRNDDEWVLESVTSFSRNASSLRVDVDYPGDFKEIHEYSFENGLLVSHLKSIDIMIGQVVPEERKLFIYDDRGDFISEIVQWIDFGQWIEDYRYDYDYVYNDDDLIIQFTSEFVSDGEVVGGERIVLTHVEQLGSNTLESELGISGVKLFPNPVTDLSTLEIDQKFAGEVNVNLTNIMGKVIWSQQTFLGNGLQHINLNTTILPAGNYILTVNNAVSSQSIPFIKL